MSEDIVIHVSDGKYTFFKKKGDYQIHCLRYGEPWMIFSKGSNAIYSLIYEYRQLQSENGRLRESLEDMVCQFAFWGNGGLITGGLSALELAFDVLGWNEPHEMKSMQCDEPKCKERASCGWPSKGGYRNTCSKHMQNLKETEE